MSIREVAFNQVHIMDSFWSPRQRLMTDITIPYMEKILRDEIPGIEQSHAVNNFRIAAGEERGAFCGIVFLDSDVAKWLEAAAYSLALKKDMALERRVDEMVALIEKCQQPDGYLNTYFTVKEPRNKWTNLLECHELYCAGHMLEAGVALYEALHKDEMLRVCVRLANHICARFGEGGQEGIPGHQEIEIGLMRLFRATGDEKYRDMALRFLDLRGCDTDWFAAHTPEHPGVHYGGYDIDSRDAVYNQSDIPVREQTAVRGHAVRQMYMLAAMADVARDTNDTHMRDTCERLFLNITQKQMYVTGAVGAAAHHEAFTVDYDLPSDRGYSETCASVAMAFFAHNMLGLVADGRYADLLELELFNAALASMQLDGKRFFYTNPLAVDTSVSGSVPGYDHVQTRRPAWHACACCPPNLARLIASLGKYIWSEDENAVYNHLFVGSEANTLHGRVRLDTGYPWEGRAEYTILDDSAFVFAIHIPQHVKNARVTVCGVQVPCVLREGYCYLSRRWTKSDTVRISFDMPVRRLRAHPRVRDAVGKVALARGPIVYCVESADHPCALSSLVLPRDANVQPVQAEDDVLAGMTLLRAPGLAQEETNELYTSDAPRYQPCDILAIPYFAWANRVEGDMRVWLHEG